MVEVEPEVRSGRAAAVRAALLSPVPDPRIWQSGIALLAVLDVLLRAGSGLAYSALTWSSAGLALLAAVTLAAFVVPWSRVPHAFAAAVPVLDVLVIGLLRLSPESGGSAVTVVVPVVWLAALLGRRGVVVAVASTVGLLSVPQVVVQGPSGSTIPQAVLFPTVVALVAALVAFGHEALLAGQAEAEERGRRLTQALEELRHQQEVNATVLDAVDVGLVLLDAEGRYVWVNRRHRDFLDLAYPDGHLGRAGQLGHVLAEDRRTVLGRDDMPTVRAMAGEEFDDLRMWVGADPVDRRALSVSARTVRGPDGRPAGAALAYTDVTELVRAMRVKDEFVAAVSHELRTPLTSIVGYVDLMQDEADLPPTAARHLAVVARNGERLLRLVEDLLASVRAGRPDVALHPAVTDLAELVRESIRAASAAAGARRIDVVGDLPPSLPALVDPVRCAQVVDNLLGNAVKYTPLGGRVEVSLDAVDDDAVLVVADDGPGIAPADAERIFTRFFRTRDAEDGDVPGLGLGLSISRSVVEAHGGTIALEPTQGRGGTRIRVRLPLRSGQPAGRSVPASSTQAVPTFAKPSPS